MVGSVPRQRFASAEFVLQRTDALQPVLQPVIDLDTGTVAGYEALVRIRSRYPQLSPTQLFTWARRSAKLRELDWACRCAAFRTAIAAGVTAPMALLVNAEPAALDSAVPVALLADLQDARRNLRVVVELTERHLADNPVRLFRVIDSMRALGWEIAVDDVGAEPVSLALLPLIEPDVIKLDRAVVTDPTNRVHAVTAVAVAAETARTGAVVIAEGIETQEQLEIARALGARFAQGFLWGQPQRTARHDLVPTPLPMRRSPAVPTMQWSTEFMPPVSMSTAELDALIEVHLIVADTDASGVVLAGWPTGIAADKWRRMLGSVAATCPFVGSYTTHDGRCELMTLSAGNAAMVTATPRVEPDRWDVVTTYRRPTVVRAAQMVARRVTDTGAMHTHPRDAFNPRAG